MPFSSQLYKSFALRLYLMSNGEVNHIFCILVFFFKPTSLLIPFLGKIEAGGINCLSALEQHIIVMVLPLTALATITPIWRFHLIGLVRILGGLFEEVCMPFSSQLYTSFALRLYLMCKWRGKSHNL